MQQDKQHKAYNNNNTSILPYLWLTQEVVGDAPHPLISQHYPDDHEVAHGGHYHHAAKEERPQQLPPPRQDERLVLLLEEFSKLVS